MVNPEIKNLYVDSRHILYDAVSNLLTVTCVAEEIMCSALQQW